VIFVQVFTEKFFIIKVVETKFDFL